MKRYWHSMSITLTLHTPDARELHAGFACPSTVLFAMQPLRTPSVPGSGPDDTARLA